MGYRRTATDPHATARTPVPARRAKEALHAVLPTNSRPSEGAKPRRSRILGPQVGPPRQVITPIAEATGHLPAGLVTTREPVVAPARGKCTRRTTPRRRRVREDLERRTIAERHAESHERYSRPHPFASKRFHVLLNSLFKVLFNFPSRYLSAIGLVSVFSLRWSLPPA
jgi:hypothetical protein